MSDNSHNELMESCIDLIISKMNAAPLSEKKWTTEEADDLYQYAYHYYQSGKYQEAVDFFRTLTTINASDPNYWTGLAASLKMLKEYERSIEAYIISAIMDNRNPYPHAHAADCCFALGQIERGLLAIDSAEELALNKEEYKDLISQLAVIRQAWSNIDIIACDK